MAGLSWSQCGPVRYDNASVLGFGMHTPNFGGKLASLWQAKLEPANMNPDNIGPKFETVDPSLDLRTQIWLRGSSLSQGPK